MTEILLSILMFCVLIAAMAIGVLMGGKPIAGSCGGVGAALGETNYNCDICGGDPNKCDEQTESNSASLGYNAVETTAADTHKGDQ
ncbi:(Na+)-NQR maturation NqrM [Porticoccaceae bacterium]|nr:(Na+)-NQR maturation NqrM [Porticoccaceae bacterium]